MKITYELDLNTFEAWSGAVDTLNRVIEEGKVDVLEAVLEDCYPDGLDETALNDILWFEDEWVFEMCGIRSETVIREELEEAQQELEELKERFEEEAEDFEQNEEEKTELWDNWYKEEAEELKEKIAELEEELDNI